MHGAGDIRLSTEPDPVPEPGQELVRVTAVGLCGSDLHWYEDGGIGSDRVDSPLALGHEMGGEIAAGQSAGERVVIEPADPCGACPSCRGGHGNLCPNVRFAGHAPIDGGLRTLMAWPRRLLMPIPDTIVGDDVALLEPLGVALHAIELGHVRAGMSAGVFGCGPVGLLLIRALRAAGVDRIIATDVLQHRAEAAIESGADEARVPSLGGQPEAVQEWGPVDVAFEAAGEDAALETALHTVRIGGRVVVIGIPPSGQHTFEASLARERGITIVMSRRMKAHHMLRAIELVDDGAVGLDGLISARYPIDEGAAAFDALLRRDGLKVVINP
jgi:L-iditol 2-dehydrogenase